MGGDYNPAFLKSDQSASSSIDEPRSSFTSLVLEEIETQIRFYQALRKDVLLKTCKFTES